MNNFNKNCKFLKKSLSLNLQKLHIIIIHSTEKQLLFHFYHFLLILREAAYSLGNEPFWTYVDQIDMESYLAGRT